MFYLLKQLHSFIVSRDFIMPECFDSWVESIELTPFNRLETDNQVQIATANYTAVFLFDSFDKSPAVLLAMFSAWLIDNDNTRDKYNLSAPQVSVELIDDGTAEVILSIDFIESVFLVEAEGGDIIFNGKEWNVISAPTISEVNEITVATEGSATESPFTHGEP